MSIFDELGDEFCERNLVLHQLLGLVSLARRLEAFLPSRGAPPAGAANGGDRFVDALLGVISLRETLMSALLPYWVDKAPKIAPLAPDEMEGLLR